MRGSQWQMEQQARLAVLGASLTAKLVRLKPNDLRSALGRIDHLLKKGDAPRERQDPETQRLLILDWAQSLGLKVERHEHPVI
jgi:hypothetical protein